MVIHHHDPDGRTRGLRHDVGPGVIAGRVKGAVSMTRVPCPTDDETRSRPPITRRPLAHRLQAEGIRPDGGRVEPAPVVRDAQRDAVLGEGETDAHHRRRCMFGDIRERLLNDPQDLRLGAGGDLRCTSRPRR